VFECTAPGNVAENVVLEKQSSTVLTFSSGAKEAYLGYVTLRVSLFSFFTCKIRQFQEYRIRNWFVRMKVQTIIMQNKGFYCAGHCWYESEFEK
jgi:hypothetical protein